SVHLQAEVDLSHPGDDAAREMDGIGEPDLSRHGRDRARMDTGPAVEDRSAARAQGRQRDPVKPGALGTRRAPEMLTISHSWGSRILMRSMGASRSSNS